VNNGTLLKNSLELFNPSVIPGWNYIVLQNDDYSIFHSKEWSQLLATTYGYKPSFIGSFENSRLIFLLALMDIKSIFTGQRFVSMPFSDYCEPFGNSEILSDFLSNSETHNKYIGYKYIELRGGESFLSNQPVYSYGYVHKINLSKSEEELYLALRDSIKRNIKKAAREGVNVRIARNIESVNDFYKLNLSTRKKHGLPPQPLKFFKHLENFLIKNGLCEIIEARYKDRVIASSIFLLFGKKVLYKYGASDYEFQNLRPNDLLFWEAIKHYSELGYSEFSFGRTNSKNETLRKFKLGWGVQEHSSSYFRYNLRSKQFISSDKVSFDSPGETGIHNQIFKYSPKSLLKLLGTVTYRHMG